MPFRTEQGFSDPEWTAEIAATVEASAADTLWTYEHVVYPRDYDSVYPYDPTGKMTSSELQEDRPDPLQWLGHVAALTRRVRLGTGLMLLPLHNPLILAKRLATLDRLSGGRLVAGFGIGWLAEEYDALGVPFRERGRLADEHLQVLQALWQPGAGRHSGRYYQFDGVYSNPKPVAGARLPIVIGGHSTAAMRRAARYADGVFLLRQSPEALAALLADLRAEAVRIGRDPDAFSVIADAPREPAAIARLAEVGVTDLLLSLRADDPGRFADRLGRYCDSVPVGVA